ADAGNQIRTLVCSALAVEKVIGSQVDGEVWTRFDLQDWGELPVTRNQPEHMIGELRHLRDCGKIEHVTLIRALRPVVVAWSPVQAAVARRDGGHAVVSGVAIP